MWLSFSSSIPDSVTECVQFESSFCANVWSSPRCIKIKLRHFWLQKLLFQVAALITISQNVSKVVTTMSFRLKSVARCQCLKAGAGVTLSRGSGSSMKRGLEPWTRSTKTKCQVITKRSKNVRVSILVLLLHHRTLVYLKAF